jgi:hypothetical protein
MLNHAIRHGDQLKGNGMYILVISAIRSRNKTVEEGQKSMDGRGLRSAGATEHSGCDAQDDKECTLWNRICPGFCTSL